MATLLDDAEFLLFSIEKGIKDLKEKYESKQNERVLANHVWMIDQIEEKVKKHIEPLKDTLRKLKESNMGDFKSATNFDITAKHCSELEKILSDVITLYRMRANYTDIKFKWQYSMPQILENLNHLKKRFNIIKGQITRKRFEYEEDDSWF